MIVYLCDQLPVGINITGKGGNCDDLSTVSRRCLTSVIVGAWAVGGEVSTGYACRSPIAITDGL